jgi:hypothetical protein
LQRLHRLEEQVEIDFFKGWCFHGDDGVDGGGCDVGCSICFCFEVVHQTTSNY